MRPHLLLFGMYKGSEDVSDLQEEDREGSEDLHFMRGKQDVAEDT